MKLVVKDGNLELSVTNPDHGTATEEIAVEFEPESFEIGFNARYLLDIIGQIRSDNAVFLFNDAGSPTLVKEDGDAGALRADADAGLGLACRSAAASGRFAAMWGGWSRQAQNRRHLC